MLKSKATCWTTTVCIFWIFFGCLVIFAIGMSNMFTRPTVTDQSLQLGILLVIGMKVFVGIMATVSISSKKMTRKIWVKAAVVLYCLNMLFALLGLGAMCVTILVPESRGAHNFFSGCENDPVGIAMFGIAAISLFLSCYLATIYSLKWIKSVSPEQTLVNSVRS